MSEFDANELVAAGQDAFDLMMKKTGGLFPLFFALSYAYIDGNFTADSFLDYLYTGPRGKELWAAYEASGADTPYDFFVADVNRLACQSSEHSHLKLN